MPDERSYRPDSHMALDADAVCQECGSVNPEGALLCRQCGNNLRDQRLRRVVNGDILAGLPDEPSRRREWVLGSLATVGLILVFLTALYASNIAMWLVRQEAGTTNVSNDLWTGADSGRFEVLHQRLEKDPVTAQSPRAGEPPAESHDRYVGRFMLELQGESGAPPFAGGAITEAVGDTLYFVALLANGAEVRGHGKIEDSGIVSCIDGMIKQGHTETGAIGYAQQAPDGSFTLMGQSDGSDARINVTVYRLRDQ